MQEEENNLDQNNISPELKNAVSNELSSYMNPYTKTTNPTTSTSKIPSPFPPISPANKAFQPIVRTFKSDMEETIQTNHLSSVNIAVSENKKMMERMQMADQIKTTDRKNYTILIISAILIIGGIIAFAIPYYLVNKQYNQEEVPESVPSGAIISVEGEDRINLDSIVLDRLAVTLAERVEQLNIRLGSIKNLYLTEGQGAEEKAIGTDKFFLLIKTRMPAEIQRTLRPEYMFGMHNYNGNQRFLILRVGSFENAYAGMLNWEPDLWNDMKILFSLPDLSSGATSSSTIIGLQSAIFQDASYSNKDARVVKDLVGKVIFLYSIVNKNTIVLTTSVDTLKEIINRVNKIQTVTQ